MRKERQNCERLLGTKISIALANIHPSVPHFTSAIATICIRLRLLVSFLCFSLVSCKQVGRTDCLTIQCTESRPPRDISQLKVDTDEQSEQSDGFEQAIDDLLHVDDINLVSDISEPAKSQANSAVIELWREQCERMFDKYDLDRSGFLDTPEELDQCLMNLAFKLLPDIGGEERGLLVEELQAAGSILLDEQGALSQEEFVEWIEQALHPTTLGITCCCV